MYKQDGRLLRTSQSGLLREENTFTPANLSTPPSLWMKSQPASNYKFNAANSVDSGEGDGSIVVLQLTAAAVGIIVGDYVYVTGVSGLSTGIYRVLSVTNSTIELDDDTVADIPIGGSVYGIKQARNSGDTCELWLDARDTLASQSYRYAQNVGGTCPSVQIDAQGLHWLQSDSLNTALHLSSDLVVPLQATVFAAVYSAYSVGNNLVLLGAKDTGICYMGRYTDGNIYYDDIDDGIYFNRAYTTGVQKFVMRFRRNGTVNFYADSLTPDGQMFGAPNLTNTAQSIFRRTPTYPEGTSVNNQIAELFVVHATLDEEELRKCNAYLFREWGATL